MSGNSVDYKKIIQSMQDAWIESGKDGDYSKLAIAANTPIDGKSVDDQIAILKGFIDAARAMIPVFKDTAIKAGIGIGKATGKPEFVIAAGQAFLNPGDKGANMLLTAINTELKRVYKKSDKQDDHSESTESSVMTDSRPSTPSFDGHPKPMLFDYDAPEDLSEGFEDAISPEDAELNKAKADLAAKSPDPAPEKRRSFFRRS